MRQFWIYGALPLLCLYGLNLFILSFYHLVIPNDCVFDDSCPPEYERTVDYVLPTVLFVTLIMFGLTAFNAYRVFRLSQKEANTIKKYGIRLAVLLVPLCAMILFLPLAGQVL